MSLHITTQDNFTPTFPAPNVEPPSWALAREWEWEQAAQAWHRVVTSEANYIADVGDGGIRLVALQTARADGSVFTSRLSFDGDMFGRELTNPRLSLAQLIEWAAFVSAVLPSNLLPESDDDN
ncbi:hypothetical protein [Isoptericola sp. NPDC019482]|uniref:hypothetical protein n=1 Tax=Isoptericola sp. NPDC019482 TaxID=3154688 RepID=UPI0034969A7D